MEATLKLAHFTDLHYSPENLAESDRCFSFAVGDAIQKLADVGVISGGNGPSARRPCSGA
jgi:exonuclease SbcD